MIENSNSLVRLSISLVRSFDYVPTLADLSIEDVVLLNAPYADGCCHKVKYIKIKDTLVTKRNKTY